MGASHESPIPMIHVDTSFLIDALTGGSPAASKLDAWVAADQIIAMSAVAWTEFLCGPLDGRTASLAAVLVDRRLDYTVEMTTVAARLFNGTGRRRGTLTDCMIAAAAIAESTPIATGNPRDFSKFEEYGLALA